MTLNGEEGYQELQDLDQLGKRKEHWQIEFNLVIYMVLPFGYSNPGATFTVNGKTPGSVVEQRDLGVQVHCSPKVTSQADGVLRWFRACWFLSVRTLSIHLGCYVAVIINSNI